MALQHQPSLILMDINLPEMDGITAFNKIRNWNETKSIPVIAVSANAIEHDIKSALDTDFKDCITKPVDLNLLVETIQKNLDIPARQAFQNHCDSGIASVNVSKKWTNFGPIRQNLAQLKNSAFSGNIITLN